jgi:hypothetical protein
LREQLNLEDMSESVYHKVLSLIKEEEMNENKFDNKLTDKVKDEI